MQVKLIPSGDIIAKSNAINGMIIFTYLIGSYLTVDGFEVQNFSPMEQETNSIDPLTFHSIIKISQPIIAYLRANSELNM